MRNPTGRALSAALLVTLVVVAACGSDSDSSSKSTSTSSRPASSTTVPSTTQPETAVWPFADGTTRYAGPEQAAGGFAVEYLGFIEPIVGAFTEDDNRSGQVTVRPTATGPVTTVAVRRLTPEDTWWVLAATTPNLNLETPAANTEITSPVTLTGRSTAFEGTVQVDIREDGTTTPVATDFVTGGANGEIGPFSKAIAFEKPGASAGAVVLKTFGGEAGVLWEATVVRVRFG